MMLLIMLYDIYKEMSVLNHANDKYDNNNGSEKKRNQLSIKNQFSTNYPTVKSFNNNDVDEV